MTIELRPAIVTPTTRYPSLVFAAAFGTVAIALVASQHEMSAVAPATLAQVEEDVEPPVVTEVAREAMAVPPLPAREIALVVRIGGATYMKLADLDRTRRAAWPRHEAAKLSEDDYVTSAIAPVAARDVPAALRGWQDHAVVLDSTCRATVGGFAIVARLQGDPSYVEEGGQAWTTSSVLAHGAPFLAARLDGCAGPALYARDAALPPAIVPATFTDPALAARAEQHALASPEVAAAQREWTEAEQPGAWTSAAETLRRVDLMVHPVTGVRWISTLLHHDGECGMPNLKVWKLYRVDGDRLVETPRASLEELKAIDRFVDLDGDGTFEIIGTRWLGTAIAVQRASGHELASLSMEFYGCGC